MNSRHETKLIIRRGAEYLVGKILGEPELRWSISPWDAWGTRDWTKAERVARATGGDLWLFNPVAGQIREVRHGKGNAN